MTNRPERVEKAQQLQIVDFLNYLTLFRPDCLCSVEPLSRFVSNNQHICSKFATQKSVFSSAEKADNAEGFALKQ